MERLPVSSSNIAEIGYDQGAETLEVLFKNGGLYHYFNVPPVEYEQLINATSVGSYFNHNIKGRYAESRA
ncbi:MAG TPA: KTSC domain-containing protein [Vitreimonas sp.]|uniref:KTSC domain-containing protein n=1 Tax=Vitreimonas sp. TaxID=3069702 RepID=UPI002D4F2C32|nr:KTSC domain-containing protein [Vitreimonas sp.]HYD86274.1 KTSC domain-containing protein [Vitreimonas sp.]